VECSLSGWKLGLEWEGEEYITGHPTVAVVNGKDYSTNQENAQSRIIERCRHMFMLLQEHPYGLTVST
jgi:hypothetical protein